jgi:hypothetical protein
MTLAIAILIFGTSWTQFSAALPMSVMLQSAAQATSPGDSQTQQPQSQTPDSKQSSTTTTSQKTSAGQAHPAKKPVHKKKVATADCDNAQSGGPATPAQNPSTGTKTNASATGNTPTQNSGSSSAPKNCPPEKIIVRQGGTTEPSIQLAGGPGGDDASQKRDATNQMLGETENNLKKVAGQPLSANQKDSVTQIHQFMAESKSALAAGDVESARTLAWKAKLLSEDLVKPAQ